MISDYSKLFLTAISTPPPRLSCLSRRYIVKLGFDGKTSQSLTSLLSHVSVNKTISAVVSSMKLSSFWDYTEDVGEEHTNVKE